MVFSATNPCMRWKIACQTSGFKFLVQPRIRERQMTMTTAHSGHYSRRQLAGTGDLGSQFQQGRHLQAGATSISGAGPMSALSRVRPD
jgi:hypothetical protein